MHLDLWPLIPLFAILGRLMGARGGSGTFKRLAVAVPLTALVVGLTLAGTFWISALFGAVLGLAFVIVRDPDPGIYGGNMINPTRAQIGGTFLRYLLALSFLVPLAVYWHDELPGPLVIAAVYLVVWAALATGLSRLNHIAIDAGQSLRHDTNAIREALTYGALGLAVALCAKPL